MTQRDQILKHLLEFPNSTTRQVQDSFDFPNPSVRRVLSLIRKEGLNLEVNSEHINSIPQAFKEEIIQELLVTGKITKKKFEKISEVIDEPFRRKILKVVFYCPDDPHRAGFGHKVFALTYENNDIDRVDELANALNLGTEEIDQGLMDAEFSNETKGNRSFIDMRDCVQATEFGYDDEVTTIRPPFQFPDIEVGEE